MAPLTPEKSLEQEETACQVRRLSIERSPHAEWGQPGTALDDSFSPALPGLSEEVWHPWVHHSQVGFEAIRGTRGSKS